MMSSDLVTGLVRAAMRHDLDQPSSQQRNAARLRVPEQQCQTNISFSKICLASASDFDWALIGLCSSKKHLHTGQCPKPFLEQVRQTV